MTAQDVNYPRLEDPAKMSWNRH